MPEKGVNHRERKLLFYRKEIEDTMLTSLFNHRENRGHRDKEGAECFSKKRKKNLKSPIPFLHIFWKK